MKIIDIMKDERSNCYSIMIRLKVKEYLDIIKESYEKNGNIEGQRIPIQSKTGKRIRDIMITDIGRGTILPPIVLGCVTDKASVEHIGEYVNNFEDFNISDLFYGRSLSIIDGMQRTTALQQVIGTEESNLNDIRVEVWVTESANNLIYRMLVLNTGQISWSLKKQLEVVFAHVEEVISERVANIKLFNSNDNKRSKGAGEYQLSHIVELYLAFATRKDNVDLSQEVTERFAKLDIVDLSAKFDHLQYFVEVIDGMVKLDYIFSKENVEQRILGDQYARIALISSIGKYIFGKVAVINDYSIIIDNFNEIIRCIDLLIDKLSYLEMDELKEFADLDTFNEITEKMGKIDLVEFYKNAFSDLVESRFEIKSMQQCWRA